MIINVCSLLNLFHHLFPILKLYMVFKFNCFSNILFGTFKFCLFGVFLRTFLTISSLHVYERAFAFRATNLFSVRESGVSISIMPSTFSISGLYDRSFSSRLLKTKGFIANSLDPLHFYNFSRSSIRFLL